MNRSFTSTMCLILPLEILRVESKVKKRKKKGKQKTPILGQISLTERLFNDEHIFRQESFVSLSHDHQQKSFAKNVVRLVIQARFQISVTTQLLGDCSQCFVSKNVSYLKIHRWSACIPITLVRF